MLFLWIMLFQQFTLTKRNINTPVLNNESKSTKTNRQMTASFNVILPGVLNTIVYLNLSHKCKATEMIITLLFILLIC